MADGIFFQNQNKIFDKLKADLNKYSEDLVKQIDAEIFASAEEMATRAKQKAPVDTGRLRTSIKVEKDPNSKLAYDLVANVRYAAYVEFGTGPEAKEYTATLDSEWKEYAESFKTNRPGGHTPAQPFFYPSVREVFPQMVKRIEDLIKG